MATSLKRAVLLIGLLAMGTGVVRAMPAIADEPEVTRKATSKVKPAYPEVARPLRLSGTVKLEVLVTPEGKVRTVQVIGGHPLLVNAATDAAKRWTFVTAHRESREKLVFDFVGPP
jgi:TonB family protein